MQVTFLGFWECLVPPENTDEHVISTFNFVQHGHRQEEERRRKEEQTGVVLSLYATM